jgi:hypothetical protein
LLEQDGQLGFKSRDGFGADVRVKPALADQLHVHGTVASRDAFPQGEAVEEAHQRRPHRRGSLGVFHLACHCCPYPRDPLDHGGFYVVDSGLLRGLRELPSQPLCLCLGCLKVGLKLCPKLPPFGSLKIPVGVVAAHLGEASCRGLGL